MKKLFSLVILCASVAVNAQTTLQKATPVEKANPTQENKTNETKPTPTELKKTTAVENKEAIITTHSRKIETKTEQKHNEQCKVVEKTITPPPTPEQTPSENTSPPKEKIAQIRKIGNEFEFSFETEYYEALNQRYNYLVNNTDTFEKVKSIQITQAACKIIFDESASAENQKKTLDRITSHLGFTNYEF
jgi:hypothetical protein